MAISMRLFTSLWMAQNALLDKAEIDAMWASIHRVVSMDIHGATQTGTLSETLTLTEADGTTYRYLTNSSRQFVRVRTGGGTAVIATGVQRAGVTIGSGVVTLTVTFRDGETREMSVCTLAKAGH